MGGLNYDLYRDALVYSASCSYILPSRGIVKECCLSRYQGLLYLLSKLGIRSAAELWYGMSPMQGPSRGLVDVQMYPEDGKLCPSANHFVLWDFRF